MAGRAQARPALVSGVSLLALVLLSCRPNVETRADSAVGSAGSQPVMTVRDSLGLELIVPERSAAGETVRFTLRVHNLSDHTLDLYLRGRESTFDIAVTRPTGEVVWRRLEHEVIPAIVHLRTLAPNEHFELSAEWNQQDASGRAVAEGQYTARGFLLAETAPFPSPPKTFRIVAR